MQGDRIGKARKGKEKEKEKQVSYRPIYLMNIDSKFLNKILEKLNPTAQAKITNHVQVVFISGRQDFSTYMSL